MNRLDSVSVLNGEASVPSTGGGNARSCRRDNHVTGGSP